MRRHRLITLATLLLLLVPFLAGAALREHAVQVDFSFDSEALSERSVSGYRLYQEDEMACESTQPSEQQINCTIMSNTGVFNFTLTAVYDDGSESPRSPPFPFTVLDETSPLLGLQVLTGQGPEGIEGLGGVTGEPNIELADVILLLQQRAAAQ